MLPAIWVSVPLASTGLPTAIMGVFNASGDAVAISSATRFEATTTLVRRGAMPRRYRAPAP